MTVPTMRTLSDGTREWRLDGGLHRTDGPAVEYPDGDRYWWTHGKIHRTDGPAIEWSDGRREWWVTHRRHRLDGPAVEYADGARGWYVNGRDITHRVRPYLAEGMTDADAITAALIDLERENAD